MKKIKESGMGILKSTLSKMPIIALIAYSLMLIYLTLFSRYFGRVWLHRGINLHPFITIYRYIASSGNAGSALINLAGNIIVFIPFGYLLPMVLKDKIRFLPMVCCILSASIFIEILQYIMGVGVSDIDDVILNAAGGILGYYLYKISKIVIVMR